MPARFAWSADGGLVAYAKSHGARSGLWVADVRDGEMDPDRVLELPWGTDDPGEQEYIVEDIAFSDDGDYLLVSMMRLQRDWGIPEQGD